MASRRGANFLPYSLPTFSRPHRLSVGALTLLYDQHDDWDRGWSPAGARTRGRILGALGNSTPMRSMGWVELLHTPWLMWSTYLWTNP